MKELNQKLAIVQTKLKTKKTSYNNFGKYYFRKAEDILEAVKPFLLEQGVSVTISEEIIATDPVPTLQSTATISDGENQITATAVVGVDLKQKGMQTAQQFGAASSYGKKYALGNLFLIDDTQDSDATNDHGSSNVVKKLKEKKKPILHKGTESFDKAMDYVKAGGKLETIEAKYNIHEYAKEELEQLQNGQQTKVKDTKKVKK
jgi:hypothetical protein